MIAEWPQRALQLLAPGELAPGVHADEFAARRQRLAAMLPPQSLAIVPSAPTRYMAGVIPYPYRQAADFYYLTGVRQEGVAMLHKGRDEGAHFLLKFSMRCGMCTLLGGVTAEHFLFSAC